MQLGGDLLQVDCVDVPPWDVSVSPFPVFLCGCPSLWVLRGTLHRSRSPVPDWGLRHLSRCGLLLFQWCLFKTKYGLVCTFCAQHSSHPATEPYPEVRDVPSRFPLEGLPLPPPVGLRPTWS